MPARIERVRARRQQISRHDFRSMPDLVSWMGAVQAQDPAGARWAIGVRSKPGSLTEGQVERALDDGRLVRTHAMRFTWQLIAAEDVRWIVALVGPRVLARATGRHAQLGLDAKSIAKSNRAIAKALRGGAHLTRAEIAEVLSGAGVSPAGQRLPHLLGCAELEGIIGNGVRREKQPTWALLDERIPRSVKERTPRDRDAALCELARRYFQSRAPATAADFIWWSGLAPAEARRAMNEAGVDDALAKRAPPAGTHLLPPFDEYLVGYKDRSAIVDARHAKRLNAGGGLLAPSIVDDGRIIGTWRRTLGSRSTVRITHDFFEPPNAAQRRAVRDATDRYATFIGCAMVD